MTEEQNKSRIENNRIYRQETISMLEEEIKNTPSGEKITFSKLRKSLFDKGDINAHMRIMSVSNFVLKNNITVYKNEYGYWNKKY